MADIRKDRLLMINTTVKRIKYLINWCNDEEKKLLKQKLEEVIYVQHK